MKNIKRSLKKHKNNNHTFNKRKRVQLNSSEEYLEQSRPIKDEIEQTMNTITKLNQLNKISDFKSEYTINNISRELPELKPSKLHKEKQIDPSNLAEIINKINKTMYNNDSNNITHPTTSGSFDSLKNNLNSIHISDLILENEHSLKHISNLKNEYMFNMLLDSNHKELMKQDKRLNKLHPNEENVITESS